MATQTPQAPALTHDAESIVRDRLYTGGEWAEPLGDGVLEVGDSATEKVMGRVPEGTAADADRAVAAARTAFEVWSQVPAYDRAQACLGIGMKLAERGEEIAALVSREVGMPIELSAQIQAGLPTMDFMCMPDAVDATVWEEQVGNSLVVREPVGVVGCITPWNYPLHQIAAKIGPALAAGCTVVVKPSEVAPLNAFALAEIIDDVGLPPGVFNLVTGTGPVVGEAIAAHPDVDMVSFTGSTRAGKRVSELGAQTIKKVALELGGKSANVILPDADLAKAVKVGVSNCYLNSGQTCTAWTRMLVHESQYDEAVEIARQTAESFTIGDPFDESTRLGPLVSKAQRDRVASYIEKGKSEGARVVTGGNAQPKDKGYFVEPTVFADVTTDMTIAQEEIFGPVLSILKYRDEDEALEIANDSVYGLAGGVWSGDAEKGKAFARKMQTGQVDINGGSFNVAAPFGGFKQSGVGRELGPFGLEEFTQPKSLQL